MDRRTLIKSAAVLAAPAIVTNARAQSVTTLRFHTFVPAMSTAYSRLITPWMAKIEQESGGRLKFQAFPSMQLGGAPAQLYDQARDGVVDVVWSLAGYTPGRFPRSEAFELPFFTYDAEGSSRAAWDYIANYAPDEFREVKLLACHTHGLNILHMKSKLVTKASDMRGLKVRGSTRTWRATSDWGLDFAEVRSCSRCGFWQHYGLEDSMKSLFGYNSTWNRMETELAVGDEQGSDASVRDAYDSLAAELDEFENLMPDDPDGAQLRAYLDAVGTQLGLREEQGSDASSDASAG